MKLSVNPNLILRNFSHGNIRSWGGEFIQAESETGAITMVASGAYAAKSGALELSSLDESLMKVLPERTHKHIPANIRAIKAGADAIIG